MVAKGYTTPDKVASFLGRDLSADQLLHVANNLIEPAEDWIDWRSGRQWSVASGPIVAERHEFVGPYVTLKSYPVQSIQQVRAVKMFVDDPATILVANEDYVAYNLDRGVLIVRTYGLTDFVRNIDEPVKWDYIEVDYTPVAGNLPARFGMAATILVSYWLTNSLDPSRFGYRTYGVGNEEMRVDIITDIPDEVKDIVRQSRPPFIR